MSTGFFKVDLPQNETVLQYAPNSPESKALKESIQTLKSQVKDIPMYIGGERVFSETKNKITPPHDHQFLLAYYSKTEKEHVEQAIQAALNARTAWVELSWEHRASIFLKAAELLATKYRFLMNAATMLGQSKNAYQAEIDSACELIDFLRFNVYYLTQIYSEQPKSSKGVWNRLEYRPLEGFIFALTPFNFSAIGGNLPTAPAIMGNVVVWKPAMTQIYSASVFMEILLEAGLPPGVINLVYPDGTMAGEVIFTHKNFTGIHFTGGTSTFNHIWKIIANNIDIYKTYPKIVGETGGKDFILAHESADVEALATAIVRGAFEYQGQKCSAASRAYIPYEIWDSVKEKVIKDLATLKMGTVEDFSNFINAVIDEKSFDKIAKYIEDAKNTPGMTLVAGGKYDKTKGYFIEPTIFLSQDPQSTLMCEEIFGPVFTIYLYNAENFELTLELVDQTSQYALTGAFFAQDRYAVELATKKLSQSAGNFYINDKPTGAVVGQQPFGGARLSGTNDKAGSYLNLIRWTSARTIKETFVPPTDYRYPFLGE